MTDFPVNLITIFDQFSECVNFFKVGRLQIIQNFRKIQILAL